MKILQITKIRQKKETRNLLDHNDASCEFHASCKTNKKKQKEMKRGKKTK